MANAEGRVTTHQNWTKSDTNALPGSCATVYVGGTGNVALEDFEGTVSLLENVPAGTYCDIRGCKYLRSTLTTDRVPIVPKAS